MKKYFLLHLLPSRSDFAFTMTEEEKAIMQQHVQYLKGFLDDGKALIFGPVFDPKGPYGLGILTVADEEEVKTFIKNDPASKINRYEYYPMNGMVK
jgi:uncharacterized protein